MSTEEGAFRLDERYIAELFPVSARLRQAGPVHRVITPEGQPAWLVTRYADVRAALADPALSLSKAHAHSDYRGSSLPAALDAHLLNLDPPDHTRLRRLVAKAFTTRRIEGLRGLVQRTADQLLDRIADQGHADLVESYAAPLPMEVICELLGVSPADRGDFRTWTHLLIDSAPDRGLRLRSAMHGVLNTVRELIARKRVAPGDDLLSALIQARDVEDRLTEDELLSVSFLLFAAGYETAMNLIGLGIHALLGHPERRALLAGGAVLPPAVVEELLRHTVPAALSTRRFPVREVEIGGVRIPAGDMVLLSLAAANRDPERFGCPDQLLLSRGPSAHVSFGHGIHFCLGAPLARLEAQVAIGTVLHRFPALALADPSAPPQWRQSVRTRGLRRLPVTF